MATLQSKSTEYGTVHRLDGGCKDDWANIITDDYYRKQSGVVRRRKRAVSITLQKPALIALQKAEAELGIEIVVSGSARTCAYQAELYKKDPDRYAAPWEGLHCQALAIDVNTGMLTDRVKHALKRHGFTQARPVDEPWHFSYGWTA